MPPTARRSRSATPPASRAACSARSPSPASPRTTSSRCCSRAYASASSARVALGTEVTGLVARADGVEVGLRDVRTGAARTVRAGYVVAADGARSAVRRALGIDLVGADDVLAGVTRCCARRSGTSSASTATSSTRSITPTPPAPSCPPAARIAGCMGSAPGAAPRRTTSKPPSSSGLAAGVPDLPVRIEGSRPFSSAAQLASASVAAASCSPATPPIASPRAAGQA